LRLADNSILHLEFQTTLWPGELTRFAAYNLAVFRQYEQPVWTVVLYGSGIRSALGTWRAGSPTLPGQNILVGQEDRDAMLQRLGEKATCHTDPPGRGRVERFIGRAALIAGPDEL
jgi:hypothetical protein